MYIFRSLILKNYALKFRGTSIFMPKITLDGIFELVKETEQLKIYKFKMNASSADASKLKIEEI